MNLFQKLFKSKNPSGDLQVIKDTLGLSEPDTKGIRVVGPCNLKALRSQLVPSLSSHQLQFITQTIVDTLPREFTVVSIACNGSKDLPPNSMAFAVGLFGLNHSLLLLNWNKGRQIFLSTTRFLDLRSKLKPINDLPDLIEQAHLNSQTTADIDFTTQACEPFLNGAPPIQAKVGMLLASPIDEIMKFDELADAANRSGSEGDFEKSLSLFQTALKQYPGSARGWTGLAASLISMKRFSEAISCCDKALELDSHQGVAHFNKGIALLNGSHNIRAALESFRAAKDNGVERATALLDQLSSMLKRERAGR